MRRFALAVVIGLVSSAWAAAASTDQLSEITRYTTGTIFDGRKDLVAAFRAAKGYN